MEKHLAYFTHEDSEVGHLYYFAPADRAPGPYLKQVHVNAIVDIAADGTLGGVELIDSMPPPPKNPRLDGVPPEIARRMSEAQPAVDAAEAFIAAVIKAEGDDWYRESDEGGLLLCHESGAYFDVCAAMMSVIPTSSVERAGYSDADALRDLQESILQSTTISDFMAVKKTVEAIRKAEND